MTVASTTLDSEEVNTADSAMEVGGAHCAWMEDVALFVVCAGFLSGEGFLATINSTPSCNALLLAVPPWHTLKQRHTCSSASSWTHLGSPQQSLKEETDASFPVN